MKNLRPTNWLFCCSMPRSGSTVVYQAASEYLERTGLGYRAPYSEGVFDPSTYKGGIEVHKVHWLDESVKKVLRAGSGRLIVTHRDPRDAYLSYLDMFGEPPDMGAIIEVMESCDRFDHLELPYAKIVSDLSGCVTAIAKLLNAAITPAMAASVATNLSIPAQKRRLSTIAFIERYGRRYDPRTCLHENHIKDAASGKWKALPDEVIRQIESDCGAWMVENGYELSRDG